MAFNKNNFAPLGNASKPLKVITSGALGHGAPQHWTYATEDAHATIDTAGYFNESVAYGGVYNLLNIGDVIHVTVFASGDVSTYGTHLVADKASGTVDVTNVTVGTVTDSD